MNEIKELLEKYGYLFHRTYSDEGDGEIQSYFNKTWNINGGADYFIHVTNKHFEIWNCPEEQGFLRCLVSISLEKKIDLNKIEKKLKKYN